MKHTELYRAFQYVDDIYLDIVEQERTPGRKRYTWVFWNVVAACICLILIFPIVAIAANWFGLRDLIVSSIPYESSVTDDEQEEIMQSDANDEQTDDDGAGEFIGLAGYQGSAEAQALAEWQAFLAGYDTDHKLLREIGNEPTGLESRYGLYSVYTQDMADKLEEIIQKYDLKLHTEMDTVSPEELVLCIGGEFMQDEFLKYWGYIYEDGSFRFDGDVALENLGLAGYQFSRTVKGTFDEVVLFIGNVEDYQEVQYSTSSGETVMVALGPDKALLYMDSDSCFIALNLLEGSNEGITEDILKELADSIDFSFLKNVQTPKLREDAIP